MKYDDAIQELGAWMGSLPLGHPERLGALRAIEVLRTAQGELGFGTTAKAAKSDRDLLDKWQLELDTLPSQLQARVMRGAEIGAEMQAHRDRLSGNPRFRGLYKRVLIAMQVPEADAEQFVARAFSDKT